MQRWHGFYLPEKRTEPKTISEPKRPFTVTTVLRQEISQNPAIAGQLNNIQQKLNQKNANIQNRAEYSAAHDFFIETEYATYIENQDGSYHSYTFFIWRTQDNGLLENLFFSLQADGSYRTSIVVYDFSLQEREDLTNGLYMDLEGRFTASEIDMADVDPSTLKRISNEFVVGSSTYWTCNNNVIGHNADTPRNICHANSFEYIVELKWGVCPSDGGSAPNPPPNTGTGNGTNNPCTNCGSSGSGNPNATSPTQSQQPWTLDRRF